MSNKIIPFPFSAAFSAYKQARNQDTKKVIFKNFLETYVKLNMAIHLSWILKSRKQDIPANLRVQIVQLFQKPPSIGFCHSISKSVNPIMLNDVEQQSQLSYFAKFFDRNESSLSRLIEIRNAEAHGSIKFEKDIHDEIREHMQILIMQPLFTSSCMIISGYEDMLKAGFDHPKGIEQSDYQFLLLKEEFFIEDEYSVLDGTELSLFPFAISNEKADICLWNQRSGKKGTYTSFLSETIKKIEVTGITEFAGFPYEDWKRSANPIYVNYLTCKNRVQEELLDDEKIGIEEWHNEILHAFRLEKDLKLDKYERIGYKSYVSGILQKLSKNEDDDINLNYHRKIFDLKDSLDDFNLNDRGYLIQEIFKSCTFLFWNAMNENKRDKFNYYYKEGLELIPIRFYETEKFNDEILLQFLGGVKKINNAHKIYQVYIGIQLCLALILLILIFIFLKGYILGIVIFLYPIILFYYIHKFHTTQIFSFLDTENFLVKRKISIFLLKLFQLAGSSTKLITLNIKNISSDKKYKLQNDYEDIASINLEVFKIFRGEQKITKFFIPDNFSDFQKIYFNFQEIAFEVQKFDSKNVIQSLVHIGKEDWLRYKKSEFNASSTAQIRYIKTCLNEIVYWNNLKILNQLNRKEKSKKIKNKIHFDTFIWDNSTISEDNLCFHNYLLGWCFASINELEKSREYFKQIAFESKGFLSYWSLYNLAQIYASQNMVSEYYLTYLTFNKRLQDEVESEVEKIGIKMIKNVKHELKGMEKHFNEIYGEKFSEFNLKKANLVWQKSKEFEFYGKLKYMHDNVQITLKYIHEEK